MESSVVFVSFPFFFQLDIGPLKKHKQWKIPIQQLLIANNTCFWWFFGKPLFFFPFSFSFSRFRKDLQSVLFCFSSTRSSLRTPEKTAARPPVGGGEGREEQFCSGNSSFYKRRKEDTPAGRLLLSFSLSFTDG